MRLGLSQAIAMVCFLAAPACTPLKKLLSSGTGETHSAQSVPESAGTSNSETQTQPRPLVSNAFAYARYAALNLADHATNELSDAQVRDTLLTAATQSDVALLAVVNALETAPKALPAGASTSQVRFWEHKQQHDACVSANHTAVSCCRAMAWPLAVLPRFQSLSESTRAQLRRDAAAALNTDSKREKLIAWQRLDPRIDASAMSEDAIDDSTGLVGAASYRLAGVKAWLGVCHAVLSGAPRTLEAFYSEHAPNHGDSSRWHTQLHAKSRAKRQPRRVYMRHDGQLSIAETLSDSCSVSETEVILRRGDGSLNYWVYDANGQLTPESHFPAPTRGGQFVTAVKLAPDSCMGCHYDFVTRQFDQLKVSADHLRLPKTDDLPVRCAQTGETIATDN